MSKVSLTVIATVNPDGQEELAHYAGKAGELYEKVGAKPINKIKITKSLVGDQTPNLISIMEFPDIDTLNQVFGSDDYKELLPYREKAFLKLEAYIGE